MKKQKSETKAVQNLAPVAPVKKTMDDFTPEIQAKIPEYIARYSDPIFKGDYYRNFKLENAEKLIDWQYNLAGYKKPTTIYANNPFEAQILFNYIKNCNESYQEKCKVIYDLKNKEKVTKNDLTKVRTLTESLINELFTEIRSTDLSKFEREKLFKHNTNYLYTSDVFSNVLLCWFKFINDEFKINCEKQDLLNEWNDLYVQSGIYNGIYSELLCIVCKYPHTINRNDRNQLHCTTGYAVEFDYLKDETKFNLNFINGRFVNEENYNKALTGKLTKEEFLNEPNEDTKAAYYEIIGEIKMMEFLNTYEVDSKTVVHKNGETEVIKLFQTKDKFPEIDNKPLAWIQFICPSTGSKYNISTNPNFKDAIEAAKFHRPFEIDMEYKWDFRS